MNYFNIHLLIFTGGLKGNSLFFEKTPSHVSIPPNQHGTVVKDAWRVTKIYWRRERAHDKTGESKSCARGVYRIYRVPR